MKQIAAIALVLGLAMTCGTPDERHRVFVFTDINLVGGDPDDRQSLVHLLWHADELEIVGIVPDRWNGRGDEACLNTLRAYQSDYESYQWKDLGFPSSEQLRDRFFFDKEKAITALVEAAHEDDSPLYVLVWGAMHTVRDALDRHPEIASSLRILSIGTGRKYGPKDEVPGIDCNVPNWNGGGRNEIYGDVRFSDMWWLESNWTYNGMFIEPGPTEMLTLLAGYGEMGHKIKSVTSSHSWAQYFRVGDTPTVTYLLDPEHDAGRPDLVSWAGLFRKPFADERPHYYTDDCGSIEWNYRDPCQTWQNLVEMYAYNKRTLHDQRQNMYEALLAKLDRIYDR